MLGGECVREYSAKFRLFRVWSSNFGGYDPLDGSPAEEQPEETTEQKVTTRQWLLTNELSDSSGQVN